MPGEDRDNGSNSNNGSNRNATQTQRRHSLLPEDALDEIFIELAEEEHREHTDNRDDLMFSFSDLAPNVRMELIASLVQDTSNGNLEAWAMEFGIRAGRVAAFARRVRRKFSAEVFAKVSGKTTARQVLAKMLTHVDRIVAAATTPITDVYGNVTHVPNLGDANAAVRNGMEVAKMLGVLDSEIEVGDGEMRSGGGSGGNVGKVGKQQQPQFNIQNIIPVLSLPRASDTFTDDEMRAMLPTPRVVDVSARLGAPQVPAPSSEPAVVDVPPPDVVE